MSLQTSHMRIVYQMIYVDIPTLNKVETKSA